MFKPAQRIENQVWAKEYNHLVSRTVSRTPTRVEVFDLIASIDSTFNWINESVKFHSEYGAHNFYIW